MTTNEEDEFYCALGRAIAEWANVEQSLFLLYEEIMKPQIWVLVSATYHVIRIFSHKLNFVDMAMKTAYSDSSYEKILEEWSTIKNRLSSKSQFRNDIAHLTAFKDLDDIYLRPEVLNAKALLDDTSRTKRYSKKRLLEVTEAFTGLKKELDSIRRRLPDPPLVRR